MDESRLDMESVIVEFDEDTIAAIDEKAFTEHRNNREAAIRDLLDGWLKQDNDEAESGPS